MDYRRNPCRVRRLCGLIGAVEMLEPVRSMPLALRGGGCYGPNLLQPIAGDGGYFLRNPALLACVENASDQGAPIKTLTLR